MTQKDQEIARGIIETAEANGIVLRAEGDQLIVEYLAGNEPDEGMAELLRTCRADIVKELKARMWNMS